MQHIRKKAAALMILLALALCQAMPASAEATAFSDVADTHWAAGYIAAASDVGLIRGVGGGKFGLKQTMTRAAFVTVLDRLFAWDEPSAHSGIADNQDESRWYYAAVERACAGGALTAQEKLFRPDDPITREDAAVMLVRALGYTALAGQMQDKALPFTDLTTNRGYIAVAYDMGILQGISATRFAPDATTTREQAAAMLMRVYERLRAEVDIRSASDAPEDAIEVASITDTDGVIPVSPVAPLENLYAVLRDNSDSAVLLNTAPLLWTQCGSAAHGPSRITQKELASHLAAKDAQVYRSSRYAASYLVRGSAGERTVVWYESAEDLAQAQRLAAMFGRSVLYVAGAE